MPPEDLQRFVDAQDGAYERALEELRTGQKRTHWMWFVFPQIEGLGSSSNAKYYAIESVDEARRYLEHAVLGPRLRECAETVLAIDGRIASKIFGYPDDLKLRSSMTLFETATIGRSVFGHVLDKFFDGERDARTLEILEGNR